MSGKSFSKNDIDEHLRRTKFFSSEYEPTYERVRVRRTSTSHTGHSDRNQQRPASNEPSHTNLTSRHGNTYYPHQSSYGYSYTPQASYQTGYADQEAGFGYMGQEHDYRNRGAHSEQQEYTERTRQRATAVASEEPNHNPYRNQTPFARYCPPEVHTSNNEYYRTVNKSSTSRNIEPEIKPGAYTGHRSRTPKARCEVPYPGPSYEESREDTREDRRSSRQQPESSHSQRDARAREKYDTSAYVSSREKDDACRQLTILMDVAIAHKEKIKMASGEISSLYERLDKSRRDDDQSSVEIYLRQITEQIEDFREIYDEWVNDPWLVKDSLQELADIETEDGEGFIMMIEWAAKFIRDDKRDVDKYERRVERIKRLD